MGDFTFTFLRGSNTLASLLAVFCAPCDVYSLCLSTKYLHRVRDSVCLSTRLLGISLRRSLSATLRAKGVVSFEALATVFRGYQFVISGSSVLQAVFGENWGGDVDCYIGNANSKASVRIGRKMAELGFEHCQKGISSSSTVLPGLSVLKCFNSNDQAVDIISWGSTWDIYRDPEIRGMTQYYRTPLDIIEQFDIEACKSSYDGTTFRIRDPHRTFKRMSKCLPAHVCTKRRTDRKIKYESRGFVLQPAVVPPLHAHQTSTAHREVSIVCPMRDCMGTVLTPDARTILSCSESNHDDGNVIAIDAETGKYLRSFNNITAASEITHVTVSPDGQLVAFYVFDDVVDLVVCNMAGRVLHYTEAISIHLYGLSEKDDLQFSSDGKLLMTLIHRRVNIYNASTGTMVVEDLCKAKHCRFAPNGEFIAAVNRSRRHPKLRVFETGKIDPALWRTRGIPVRDIGLHTGWAKVVSFAVSNDSTLIAHGGEDGMVRVENILTGVLVHERFAFANAFFRRDFAKGEYHVPVDNVCFSPNDKFFTTSARDEVRIWDVVSGDLCYMFDSWDSRIDSDGELHSLQYSHDSRMLLTAGDCLVARMTDVSFVKTTRHRLREELAVALGLYRKNTHMFIDAVEPTFVVFCGILIRLSQHLVIRILYFI